MTQTKHRGASSELVASVWLLGQGYEVFRNVSACGLVDIIAMRKGEITLVDVKTISVVKLKTGGRGCYVPKPSKEMLAGGVRLLGVHPVTGACMWFDEDNRIFREHA